MFVGWLVCLFLCLPIDRWRESDVPSLTHCLFSASLAVRRNASDAKIASVYPAVDLDQEIADLPLPPPPPAEYPDSRVPYLSSAADADYQPAGAPAPSASAAVDSASGFLRETSNSTTTVVQVKPRLDSSFDHFRDSFFFFFFFFFSFSFFWWLLLSGFKN